MQLNGLEDYEEGMNQIEAPAQDFREARQKII
jgi:hypothetical protein